MTILVVENRSILNLKLDISLLLTFVYLSPPKIAKWQSSGNLATTSLLHNKIKQHSISIVNISQKLLGSNIQTRIFGKFNSNDVLKG